MVKHGIDFTRIAAKLLRSLLDRLLIVLGSHAPDYYRFVAVGALSCPPGLDGLFWKLCGKLCEVQLQMHPVTRSLSMHTNLPKYV